MDVMRLERSFESSFRRTWTLGVAAAALALLGGCAVTHLSKPAEDKNHPGRVTQARVIWSEPVGLPYQISKVAVARGYTPAKPVIDDEDRRQARTRVEAVVAAYREKGPVLLGKALAGEGVRVGDETRIFVRPVSASVDGYNGHVFVAVEVSVLHADAKTAWTITPVSQNFFDAPYWNVFRKPGIGDGEEVDLTKLVDSFSASVVREMRRAGWFR